MRLSDNTIGALLMITSMAAYTVNDTVVKSFSDEVPFIQVIFLRGILTSAAVALIAWRMGAFSKRISRRDSLAICVRVISEVAATYFFLSALYHLPLANVTALLQALPLAITLAALVVLRERVGLPRLLAVVVGFIGILLIVQPGADGFNFHALYGLAAVFFLALRDLATRSLSRETSSMLVTFVTAVTVTAAFGGAGLGVPWVPLGMSEWLRIGVAAGLIVIGYLSSIMVVRVGDISFTAPFRYTALLWALMLGWLVFGDWPSPLVLLGAGIVAASGIYTLYRETRSERRKRGRLALRQR